MFSIWLAHIYISVIFKDTSMIPNAALYQTKMKLCVVCLLAEISCDPLHWSIYCFLRCMAHVRGSCRLKYSCSTGQQQPPQLWSAIKRNHLSDYRDRPARRFSIASYVCPKGEGTSRIFGGGVPPGSPNSDPISDQKNVIFQTRFQTWPLKSIPVFRPGL